MGEATEAMVDAGEVRLWTSREGQGPPLVLLHGGPGLWEDFGPLAAMVDDLVEVHRYDQRGCGRSGGPPAGAGPYDIAAAVADLEALRAHWGHERWIVGGHSFGVTLALAYALAHPERVTALVLVAGTGVDLDWREEAHTEAAARRSAKDRDRLASLRIQQSAGVWDEEADREFAALSWATDFADRRHDVDRAAELYRPPGPNYEQNREMMADWRRLIEEGFAERMVEVTVPALLLNGAQDPRPISATERLAERLPDARLVTIEECGHFPWLEQPAATRDALRAFLAELAAAS
jgi:proline iminopeptidase